MIYNFTRAELKLKKASEFKEGDVIKTGIFISTISQETGSVDMIDLLCVHIV